MATQNPIEQEGTYALPEAQLDRFFFKVIVPYATRPELNAIVGKTTGNEIAVLEPIMDGAYIQSAQRLARRVVLAPHVQDFAIRLIMATHPGGGDDKVNRYIRVGVSPRGLQSLVCAGKVRALLAGRYAVAFKDLEQAAYPAMRHRIIPSFEAQADGITTDDIIEHLLATVQRTDPE